MFGIDLDTAAKIGGALGGIAVVVGFGVWLANRGSRLRNKRIEMAGHLKQLPDYREDVAATLIYSWALFWGLCGAGGSCRVLGVSMLVADATAAARAAAARAAALAETIAVGPCLRPAAAGAGLRRRGRGWDGSGGALWLFCLIQRLRASWRSGFRICSQPLAGGGFAGRTHPPARAVAPPLG